MPFETGVERSIAVDFDVPERMRDGVVLKADVYRPAGAGPGRLS
jgi:uncharacterized protein